MGCTPTKQGTINIFGKLRFDFEIRPIVCKISNGFSGSVNLLELGIQSFLFVLFWIWQLQKMQNFAVLFWFFFFFFFFFGENVLKIRSFVEVIEDILRYVKPKNWQMGHVSTLCPMSTSVADIYIWPTSMTCSLFHWSVSHLSCIDGLKFEFTVRDIRLFQSRIIR